MVITKLNATGALHHAVLGAELFLDDYPELKAIGMEIVQESTPRSYNLTAKPLGEIPQNLYGPFLHYVSKLNALYREYVRGGLMRSPTTPSTPETETGIPNYMLHSLLHMKSEEGRNIQGFEQLTHPSHKNGLLRIIDDSPTPPYTVHLKTPSNLAIVSRSQRL